MEGLGSDNGVFDCPHCGVNNCLHTRIHDSKKSYAIEEWIENDEGGKTKKSRQYIHNIYQCVKCHRDTYFLIESWPREIEPTGSHSVRVTAPERLQVFHQFPVSTPVTHEAVPVDVQNAAEEAEKCLAIGAISACGTMVRRAVDALARDKGATGRDLFTRLQYLKDNHIITPDLWEWSEELRVAGRSGAHPEWEDLTPEEADYAVRFLRDIIRSVYVNPHELSIRRLKGNKKKK